MTLLLWTMALVCWGISAVLVAMLVDPKFFQGQRQALGGQNE